MHTYPMCRMGLYPFVATDLEEVSHIVVVETLRCPCNSGSPKLHYSNMPYIKKSRQAMQKTNSSAKDRVVPLRQTDSRGKSCKAKAELNSKRKMLVTTC